MSSDAQQSSSGSPPITNPNCDGLAARAEHDEHALQRAEDHAPEQSSHESSPDQLPKHRESAGGERPREHGGRAGPEPTRFGDWEKAGRCIDF